MIVRSIQSSWKRGGWKLLLAADPGNGRDALSLKLWLNARDLRCQSNFCAQVPRL